MRRCGLLIAMLCLSCPGRVPRRATLAPAHQIMLSMRLARISFTILAGWLSRSLNTLSTTLSSVDVVSSPQNALQSLATMPVCVCGGGGGGGEEVR